MRCWCARAASRKRLFGGRGLPLVSADANAIWITEAWDGELSHQASLQMKSVREAIMKAKPMIASFDTHIVTRPVGGHGLVKA